MNTEHHPSCTENDKSLVLHCDQCGLNEPYDHMTKDEEAFIAINTHDEEAEEALHADRKRLSNLLRDWQDFGSKLAKHLDGVTTDEWIESAKSLSAHKARLDTELAQMRRINQQQMAFFQDAAAFIRQGGKDRTWNDNIILATLVHDLIGLANDEPCFSPRVTGYAQREREKNL